MNNASVTLTFRDVPSLYSLNLPLVWSRFIFFFVPFQVHSGVYSILPTETQYQIADVYFADFDCGSALQFAEIL